MTEDRREIEEQKMVYMVYTRLLLVARDRETSIEKQDFLKESQMGF